MNSFAGHFEGGAGGFRARVGGADGEREFGEGAGGGAAIAREFRYGAQDFLDSERHADDARRADDDFVGLAAKCLGCFRDGSLCRSVAGGAGGTVGVAGVDDYGAHAAFRGAQVFLGNGDGSGGDEILREDGGGGSRDVAADHRDIERTGFLQAAGEACEPETVRERSFGKCVLHQRDIRVTSAPPPEATSSPPRRRVRCSAGLLLAGSWRGSSCI